MSMDIFISHSSRDEKLVQSLVYLLQAALGLSSTAICCTSLDGFRLPPGTSVEEQLRQKVYDAKGFIGLISKASLKSMYVAYELGARWGARKNTVPVLAGDIVASELPEPISSINVLRCDSASQLNQLVSTLAKSLATEPEPPEAYLHRVEEVQKLARDYSDFRFMEFAKNLKKGEKRLLRALIDDPGRVTLEAVRGRGIRFRNFGKSEYSKIFELLTHKEELEKALKTLMQNGYIEEEGKGHALTEAGIRLSREYMSEVLFRKK